MHDEEDGPFSLGMTAFKEKRYEEAIDHFTQSIHEHAVIHKSFNALGVTYSKLGNTREAEGCFKKAILIDPGNPIYEKNLGKVRQTVDIPDVTDIPVKSKNKLFTLNYKRNTPIMVGVTLVAIVLITLLSIQLVMELQPQMGTFTQGTLEGGLLTPWIKSLQDEDRTFPEVNVQVDNKRIEIIFDRDQDLTNVARVEATLSPTKGTPDQKYTFPTIINPQNNLYYSIDDPYPGKVKHFVMTAYGKDDISGIIADTNLPPR